MNYQKTDANALDKFIELYGDENVSIYSADDSESQVAIQTHQHQMWHWQFNQLRLRCSE